MVVGVTEGLIVVRVVWEAALVEGCSCFPSLRLSLAMSAVLDTERSCQKRTQMVGHRLHGFFIQQTICQGMLPLRWTSFQRIEPDT